MELSVQLFDKICRICLVQSANLKSLLTKTEDDDRNLLEMLGFTANIDIKIEDSLPKQLCGSCESMMCQAHAFKRRCHESERILNNVYQNTVGAAELSQGTENFSIKDEKIGLKEKLSEYGTFMSHVSSNSGVKDVFSKKNQLESDAQVCSTDLSFNKLTIPELPVSYDVPVKEETVDNIDDGEYLNDFDNRDQFESGTLETVEKTNVKPKPKGKKLGVRYECYCHAQFTNKEKYKTHLKEKKCDAYKVLKFNKGKTIKNEIQCKKCQAMFTTVYSWKQHQLIHSDENTTVNDNIELFQCTFCLRKFKNQTSLSAHMQRHEETDNIKHVCEICKREFKYKAYLENHLLTAHSRTTKTNGFTCDICVQSFLNKKDLETHKKSHETDKKHCCTVCSKGFYMLCTLKEHMRTHTGEKPFLCSQCGKGFSQKTNLAQHMRRHQGLKPFKCETCEKRFVSKGELDAHTRKHSGAHPFVCDDCGNGFTTSSALVKHRRTHTGERPYQCDLCPMRFAASGTLKNHRRTHTGERPFQCSYCEKAFVQRNDLISHIRCHTGERPYICSQCGQAFRKASGLKTHLKLHIKDPVIGVNKALVAAMHLAEQ